MAIETTTTPRSRRVLLAATAGSLAALAAQALGRPPLVRAADPNDVVLGATNTATTTTTIENTANSGTVFEGSSSSGIGVGGVSSSSYGVYGHSSSGIGVGGISDAVGVYGESSFSHGVYGTSFATDQPATVGQSFSNSTGVLGYSGASGDPLPAAPARTGVYGYAVQDATSRGVHGRSNSGRGVYGQATSGRGVHGYASTGVGVYATCGTGGKALHAQGRVSFSTSGLAPIGAGASSALVAPGVDLAVSSKILCTIEGNPGAGVTTHRVAKNPIADTFTVYLTAAAVNAVKVAWFVIG